jgi:two-component system cell cycle response regulator DivK
MTKVLLVEDNEMNRDMLSRRLIRRGFQMVFAVDGQQGIDLAHSERPDVIIMDMRSSTAGSDPPPQGR